MKLCLQATSVTPIDSYFSIQTNSIEIRVIFLTNDIVRIRAGFDGDFAEESYSLVLTAWEDRMDEFLKEHRTRVTPATATLEETETCYTLTGKKLTVVIHKDPFQICIYDKEGTPLHQDIVDLCYREDSNHRRIHTSEISPNDCFYGFGEKSGTINKTLEYMSMSPKDAMGYNPEKTDSLYKHIPFYIKLNKDSQKAVGYFYHNTFECDFNMGREKSNYWKQYSSYRTDGGDIDLFFIAGPQIYDVIERYTDLTGKSAMLPRHALGYLGSSMYYAELEKDCDDAILTFMDTNKEEGIPIDGFQLSSGYTTQETIEGNKRCVFTWNDKRFKNPELFFEEMEKRGASVSPNVKPGILLTHPNLQSMIDHDLFVKASEGTGLGYGTWWGGKGVFADFTKEENRTYWKEMLTKHVISKGTASIWNDNCEYDSMVDKDCLCDFEGKTATIGQLKAVMSNIMCHITKDAIIEEFGNKRPFVVCRSGHSGIQRYAQTWAGDNLTCWEALKYNIATILGMSLSGVANQGCDIGGFYGTAPEAELFVRWVQNGIFQPRFSVHSTNIDNTVTEPWMYGNYTQYIRSAIELRYRMIPYLYSLMERAHEKGLPIMAPMFGVFQHDTNCYEEGVTFMLGEHLLVANVVEKDATTREVYFPTGDTFYDFYTREAYQGGETVTFSVAIDSIPLFVRSGAIIPLANHAITNLHKEQVEGLHLLCAADKDGTFTLYEDDGDSLNYTTGDYLKTQITMNYDLLTTLSFEHQGQYETTVESVFLDLIHREKAPFWISVDGEQLPHFLHRKKFDEATTGWYYSQTLKSVQVKYANPKKDYTVVVSFEAFDMIGM